MKLLGKILIKGTITTLTGLHIGSSKASLNIGGIDNNVIKTNQGKPYIPGSSLKGKLRSLLAKQEGSLFFSTEEKNKFVTELKREGEASNLSLFSAAVTDEEIDYIIELFGYSGDTKDKNQLGTIRLLIRDGQAQEEVTVGSKFENVIDRRTGTAKHPRQVERVPVGTRFDLNIVYNVFSNTDVNHHLNKLILSLQLLQDDFIGGQGSRGYGEIKISIDLEKTIIRWIKDDRYQNSDWKTDIYDFSEFRTALENFNNL